MRTTRLQPIRRALSRVWTEGRSVERVAYAVGAALFASGLVHAAVLLVSGGSWSGPLSLRKATTFGLSFGLTLATVAWATSFITIQPKVRTALLGVFTVSSVVETALVSLQVWRGVPSHFNFETPFDNAVAMTLAAGGGVIIVTALGFTAAAVTGAGELSPSMRVAVRAGFVSLLLSLGIGALMIARGVVEARGGEPQIAYTTSGSLKPLHAVAMHAILVLPGLAWLLRFTDWGEAERIRLVRVAAAAYAALMVVVGIESFNGVSPFAASPIETVTSAAALIVLVASGATAVFGLLRTNGRSSVDS
jgi:hypothetical protein